MMNAASPRTRSYAAGDAHAPWSTISLAVCASTAKICTRWPFEHIWIGSDVVPTHRATSRLQRSICALDRPRAHAATDSAQRSANFAVLAVRESKVANVNASSGLSVVVTTGVSPLPAVAAGGRDP